MRQSVKFPAISILGTEDQELASSLSEILKQLESASDESQKAELLEKAKELTPEDQRKVLKETFKIDSYLDSLDVNIDLKNFLFDTYASEQKEPEAPFAKFSFQKKMQELIKSLEKEDLSSEDLDDDFCNTVKSVLSDDEKWKELKVFAYIEKPGDNLYFPMTHRGLVFFDQILNKTMEILSAKSSEES